MGKEFKITQQQQKLLEITKYGDCIVDTGRRWGKTFIAVMISRLWSENEVMVVEPNGRMCQVFIDVFKENFSENIKRIDLNHRIVVLDTGAKIIIRSMDSIGADDFLGLHLDGIIVDEYCITERKSLKKLFYMIPIEVHKCFLSTPTGPNAYLMRKYMFNMRSFHYYRFSTPNECLPENLTPGDILSSELTGVIPAEPISSEVLFLKNEVEDLKRKLACVREMLNTVQLLSDNMERNISIIDEYTL